MKQFFVNLLLNFFVWIRFGSWDNYGKKVGEALDSMRHEEISEKEKEELYAWLHSTRESQIKAQK